MATPVNTKGAVAAGGGARRRRGLLPILLGLLLLAALVVLLIALLGGDDDKTKTNAGSASTATAGALTSGGTGLLPLGDDGRLAVKPGQDTLGKAVVVQSVVKGEGFWVGTSADQRVYVEYGGAAGKTEGGYRPSKAGEKVDLDGPVKPAPADPQRTLKLTGADAQKVTAEGAYINANKVSPAQ